MANSLKIELEGKTVVLNKKYYKGDEIDRTVVVTGGFGASPITTGTALTVIFVKDGDTCRAEGPEVQKLAAVQLTEQDIEKLKEKKRALDDLKTKHYHELQEVQKRHKKEIEEFLALN